VTAPEHPAIRAWREDRERVLTTVELRGRADVLAAALEAEVKARREAEAAGRAMSEALYRGLNGGLVDFECEAALASARDALSERR
jgi:hypothetical protein